MRICAADSTPMVMKKAALLALVAALVIGTAPAAPALAAPGDTTAPVVVPTGTWRLVVTPDDAAVSAGRDAFEEYVVIESTSDITAQEMCRLGFYPSKGTLGKDVAGLTTFTVTLKSNMQGKVTWTGTFLSSTQVEGTLTWDKDGAIYNYTYTGSTFAAPVDVES